jgi:AcrR family transcriptional regulator
VVNAAASILEESGWAGLNMREVARRAGVSAGALYQWFAGKDEIYAELYTTRLNQGIASLETLPKELTLEELLTSMFYWVRRTWADLGRWQIEFAEVSRTRDPSEATTTLREVHDRLLSLGVRRLSERATTEGRTMRADSLAGHLIWSTASGIAMRAEVLPLDEDTYQELVTMAVSSILAGLAESD